MIETGKPVHVIINPRSGYGGQKRLLGDLRREIRAAGWDVVEYVTQCVADATRYAKSIISEASAVIAWGGDGTVNEVAGGLAGSDVPLLAVRAGTENLLAKELSIPKRPVDLVGLLKSGEIMDCDIGMINGLSFHSILGVGFDAEVVRRVTQTRTGHISHLSYFWPIWRTFWEHNFPRLKVQADGELIFEGRGLAFVGNISRYSSGLRICRDARFDDGLLDLVVFECDQQVRLLLHAAWTLLRRHPLKGNVFYKPARTIHIESDKPVHCQLDGDLGPTTPLDISISPHKIKLIVPSYPPGWPRPLWPWKGAPV
jgi:diacylglycerol kinase (ATP)